MARKGDVWPSSIEGVDRVADGAGGTGGRPAFRAGGGRRIAGGSGRPGRGAVVPGAVEDSPVFARTFDMMTPHPGQIRAVGSVAFPHFGHVVIVAREYRDALKRAERAARIRRP